MIVYSYGQGRMLSVWFFSDAERLVCYSIAITNELQITKCFLHAQSREGVVVNEQIVNSVVAIYLAPYVYSVC